MKIATLAIITREGRILLGLNKRGFAKGKLNGPGGKKKRADKTILACVMRETKEELGITLDPTKLEKTATITFYAASVPDFKVHIYRTSSFRGKPRETESMIPEWHDISQLPVDRMLESDRAWFPLVIQGSKFRANVYYRERMKGFLEMKFL